MSATRRHVYGLLAITLSGLLIAAPARAVISAGSTPTALHNETDGDAAADRQAVSREIERFRSSSISISQAMAIAEARHAGATTADISFDGSGVPVYRVKTLHNDRIWRYTINAGTGEVIGGEAALPLAELDGEDRSNLAALGTIRHSLADAVRVAEKAASGKAISGGLVRDRGRLNFAIVVISGDDLKEVLLEPPGVRGK